jgi:hypothetical protein
MRVRLIIVGGEQKMNYWMFTVMYDDFPTLWRTLVERGLAAQHYPQGWTNERRNLAALQQMRRGDGLIAALKGHRFSGYGFLKSDFYRGGEPLRIKQEGEEYECEFQERAKIDWNVIPLNAEKPYVECRYLKVQGYDVDLRRGLCVKSVDEKTFSKLRGILDAAGARRWVKQRDYGATEGVHEVLLLREGHAIKVRTERIERNQVARKECIRAHGTTCSVCGMSFEAEYGEIGMGYIEVHHLNPLRASVGERMIDPVADLCPVCPNCHAMLHRNDPPFTIDELKARYMNKKP